LLATELWRLVSEFGLAVEGFFYLNSYTATVFQGYLGLAAFFLLETLVLGSFSLAADKLKPRSNKDSKSNYFSFSSDTT
jgi:hypothetical protein